MKNLFYIIFTASLLLIPGIAHGQVPAPESAPSAPVRPAGELDKCWHRSRFNPDPLLAQILPASTAPADIVMAARYVAAKKDVNKIDQQPWEESVKAVARYLPTS